MTEPTTDWGENETQPCQICRVEAMQDELVKAYIPKWSANVVAHSACVDAEGGETKK